MVNQSRLVDDFCKMVEIDSESGAEFEFARYLISLADSLKLKGKLDKYSNVYIDIPGTGKPLMFHTHMDTVKPGIGIKPQIKGEFITSDGTTVLGADSKSGIAALFEMVRVFKEQKISHRPIQLTFSRNEETGMPTAVHIQSKVKECIVPDRGSPLGEVISVAPYAQVFEVTVRGKSSYATVNFSQGRHAILAATKIIQNLPIGDFREGATSNIGLINGGIMTTTVPDLCVFKGNCYAFDKSAIDFFIKKLFEVTKEVDKIYGTKTKIEMLEYFAGYSIPKSDPLVKHALSAMKKSGLSPKYKTYKAVTNANNLNDNGIKSIVISYGAEFQHTTAERIKIANLTKLSEIMIHLTNN